MEALLLTIWVFAVVLLAHRVSRYERSNGADGMGWFAYKDSLKTPKPDAAKGKRNA